MALRNEPTLKSISEETGIEQTRVFRILNGAKMRLDEWEIFQAIIENNNSDMEKLMRQCLKELSLHELGEVKSLIQSKLQWQREINNTFKEA